MPGGGTPQPTAAPGGRWAYRAEAAIHALGVAGAAVAAVVLMARVAPSGGTGAILACAVYAGGMLASFAFSALYNLHVASPRRELWRRLDHAAIFLLIAGTYTPFMALSLGGIAGYGALSAVWVAALGGAALKVLRPRKAEGAFVLLYLALGWCGLALIGMLVAVLPTASLVLLAVGGGLYSAGAGVHHFTHGLWGMAVWHAMVLAGAACHYAAVLVALPAPA